MSSETASRKNLYISEDAFWSLTLAAIEVFRKECFGFLVGYEGLDRWIVQRAITHQTARRSYSWVEPQATPRRRIEKALRSLALGESAIGWYHSHPEWGGEYAVPVPSEDDINFAKVGQVIMVLAIHSAKKRVWWGQNRDESISGTLGDFHLTIAAFTKVSAEKTQRLRVHCAYAHGFSRDLSIASR